jgi:hypothetical protein
VNATSVRIEVVKLFTSTHDNFGQTAGIRDGASHCAKILSVFYDNLDTSDPNDPEVIIKIDTTNAFNTTCRALTLNVLSGRASRDYVCGLKKGQAIPTCENLSNLFCYFKAMRTCHAGLRYFEWDGQVHLVKGKTGGQQGDPLEMLIFNLTIHNLWGRVLAKFQAVAYADEGYIKGKLSVALRILAELKRVLKEDAGLELNVSKTSILPKGTTQQAVFDAAHISASFCHEGFVGIGVPIGTDAFVQNFVAKTCRAITDDVEKLDAIQDGFIHYQLLRFCQATRLQYTNSHILLHNRCVLQ